LVCPKNLTPNPFPRGKGNNRGEGTALSPQPESEMSSSTFRDFFSPGAGVTPVQGSVKPTAGFTYNTFPCLCTYPTRS
jgi:hypothetical protein